MASFRAIHPYVRECAFQHGFVPVPGNPYRVQHPTLKGKRASHAFYKVFQEACSLYGVRIVLIPETESGRRTILFPQVSKERWEAAREGTTLTTQESPSEVVNNIDEPISLPVENQVQTRQLPKNSEFQISTDNDGRINWCNISTKDHTTALKFLALLVNE